MSNMFKTIEVGSGSETFSWIQNRIRNKSFRIRNTGFYTLSLKEFTGTVECIGKNNGMDSVEGERKSGIFLKAILRSWRRTASSFYITVLI